MNKDFQDSPSDSDHDRYVRRNFQQIARCQWPGCNKQIHCVELTPYPYWVHSSGYGYQHPATPPEE